MALSQPALQGILSSATSVLYLECIMVTHSSLATPLMLVNDNVDLVRTEGTFIAFPFTVRPPVQSSDQAATIEIKADMVDQRLITVIRTLGGKRERAQITYEVVTKGTPNVVEWGPLEFTFESCSSNGYTEMTIVASFSLGLLNDAFPSRLFAPNNKGAIV